MAEQEYHLARGVVYRSRIGDAKQVIKQRSGKAVFAAVNILRNGIVTLMANGSRTGRMYRKPGTKKYYQASAPGEPPARRFGKLLQSIRIILEQDDEFTYGFVGTDLIYAPPLETGTEDGRLQARPFFEKGYENSKEQAIAVLEQFGE